MNKERIKDEKRRKLVDCKTVSHLTGLSRYVWKRMREQEMGPPFYKIGTKKVVYDMEEVNKWLEEQRFE